jgi:hypothetical protein
MTKIEELTYECKEVIPDVKFIFVNPYQIKNVINNLFVESKLSLIDCKKIEEFYENNYELNVHPLHKLGNFDVIYTNGKRFCLCWVASKEDKELTIIKFNAFFRPEYKFLDLASNKLMTRIL